MWASRPGDDGEIEHFVAVVVVARLDDGDAVSEHVFGAVEVHEANLPALDPSTTFCFHIGSAVGAELCPEDDGTDGKDEIVVGFVVLAPARAVTGGRTRYRRRHRRPRLRGRRR